MTAIYDQHYKAFARVSAYVVTKDGAHVANVSIKFPADGAGRLYAYVHWIGLEMVRDHANGYGYDKRTAAVSGCAARILKHLDAPNGPGIARHESGKAQCREGVGQYGCIRGVP